MPLSVEEVAALVMEWVGRAGSERVGLADASGRVLAETIVSRVDLPPWDNASMDGYAVRAADVASARADAPVVLPVAATVAAGGSASTILAPGTAIRIMTGAPVPSGADSVIRVEDTDAGVDHVSIRDTRDLKRNVRTRGEDIRTGNTVAEPGTVLRAAQIGVLASVGAGEVEVYQKPRVAILATGDEIVGVDGFDDVLAGRRIVSSNSYSLRAAIEQGGAEVVELGIAPDDLAGIAAGIERALECDLIVTSGGVSVGSFDYTREAVRSLGGRIVVDRVRMRPGAPLGFGMVHDTAWLGLPGNPVSALVGFELFGRPLIRRLRGETLLFPIPIPVTVGERIVVSANLTHFLRVVVEPGAGGRPRARLAGSQSSGVLTAVSRSNALLVLASGRLEVEAGEAAPAIILGDHGLLSPAFTLE